jgi:hypothetical protein
MEDEDVTIAGVRDPWVAIYDEGDEFRPENVCLVRQSYYERQLERDCFDWEDRMGMHGVPITLS